MLSHRWLAQTLQTDRLRQPARLSVFGYLAAFAVR
jgi:hypothetical protein